MQKHNQYKSWKSIVFLILAMGIAMSLFLQIQVFAASSGTHTPTEGVTVGVSGASDNSMSNGAVTVTAKGSAGILGFGASAKTATITVTNNTASTATISFDWAASSVYQLTMDGASYSGASGTFSKLLDAGTSFTIKIVTDKNSTTNKLVMSNFSVTEAASASNVIFNYDSTLGSVTVGGTAIASGTTQEVSLSEGVALVATPKSGVTFLGWIDESDGKLLSSAASHTLSVAGDSTVRAAFASASSPAWFWAGGKYFNDLNEAVTEGSVVVLAANGALPAGDYTIPAGVTLLIPRDTAGSVDTVPPTDAGGDTYTTPSIFRKLTMSTGANIIVNGAISIGGQIGTSQSSNRNGAPSGPSGCIDMASGSSITINSGANLYAWGFVTGSGSVTIKSGGHVYENLQLRDWRGGGATTEMVDSKYASYDVFVFSQYYIQNIEAPLTLEAGAVETVYTAATITLIGVQKVGADFIGSSSGLIRIQSGSLTRRYDGSTDRIIYDINGDVTFANLQISIKTGILGTVNVNSQDYVMPINSNMTINVKSGSTVSLQQDIALLPGTIVHIESDATCIIDSAKRLYVYDSDQWGGYCSEHDYTFNPIIYAPGKTYTRTEADLIDAKLIVDGTINAKEGFLYTTSSGANITSNGKGVINLTLGTETVTYQMKQSSSDIEAWVEIPITPPQLLNGDGSYLQTAKGASTSTYSYIDGKWICATHTDVDPKDHNCDVCGSLNVTSCQDKDPLDGKCDTCGAVLCEHANKEVLPAVDATCTTSGKTEGSKCSDCGAIIVEQTEVAALGHTWNEGEITTAPTCTADGVKTYTCTTCSATKTEAISAPGHSYGEWTTTQNPTCTAKGEQSHTCGTCGNVETQEVAALGHTWNEGDITTAPTCTADGVKTYTCTTCSATKTEAISALGHTEVVDAAVAPTCTDTGLTEGKHCSVCGTVTVAQTVVDALGHDMVTDAAVSATCVATGLTEGSHCSRCDHKIAQSVTEIDPDNHTNVVVDAAKAPTCTETGLTAGSHCEACGNTVVAQEVVAATGHNYNAVVTAPTCTAEGYTTHTCSACGDSYKDSTVAATGHNYNAVVTAPTCTAQGYTTHTCSVCGDTYKDTYVDAKGHTEVVDAAVDPTCTDTGLTEGKHCSVCGTVTVAQTVVDALGHSYNSVVTAPTCTAQGYTTHTCSVCGDSYKDTYVDAKGHTEVIDAAVDPTCTDTGLTEGKHCSVCGTVTVAQTVVDALGHSYNAVVTAPTCTDKGYTTYTCSACSDSYVANEVAALGHSHNAVVTAPTCTDKGYTTYTCSVCGDSYVADEVAALGHGYTAENTAPTFEADGFTTYTCACGDSYVVTHEGTKLNAVAQIGSQKYQTFEEAFNTANPGDVITLLADVELEGITNGIGITIDLNGNTLKGTYLGTLAMNGGTLITAEGYEMAGPYADYYKTDDAVFTMSPIVGSTLVDVTVHSGTMIIVPDEWWTGKGQKLVIEENATLIIPEGKVMQVLSTVVVEGTVEIYGQVNLYDKDATIEGPAGLVNIVTTAGDAVWYTGGKYTVHDHSHAYNREIAPVDGVGANVYRCECGDEYEVATYVITFTVDGEVVLEQTLEQGTMPEIPADPTKDATAQYTYTFKGWDAEVVAANAPVTYTAVFDATVNTYTVTFVDFFGNAQQTVLAYGAQITFPETITETMYLNVTFLGWKLGDEVVSVAQSVVGDATYISSYSVDSIKFGAVWMSVSVDANINATIFVQVDHGVDFAGEGFEEIVLPNADSKLYMRAVSISAEDINNNAFGIGVTYKTLHGDISKQFSSLILTYMEALDGAPGAEDNEFSKELVTSILAYGSAVRQYFHNEFNEEWADLTVTSSELQTYYNNYNIQVSATGDLSGSNKKYVDLRSANVQFQTDYTMRYYFKLNDVDFTKITGYGVIVTDGNGYEKTYDFQGKPVRDPKDVSRYMVLYEVDAGDITKDMYVTVYVTTETETYHSDTMQYSLYKYLIRQLYMYSLTPEQGGKRVTGDTDGQKTAQYVAMLNSLLQLGKAYNEYTANISN